MRKTDDKICVHIEMFPSILSVPGTQKETEETKLTTTIQDKGKRRVIPNSPFIRRRLASSSMTTFAKSNSSKLSTADLLYVKSFHRLPRMWPSSSNKHAVKTTQKYKMDKETDYLAKSTEVSRVSYPCYNGCATCAFTSCFGPVKVFFSQFKEPKECFVREIRDGQGRNVIPRSRRKEFRGLVYDKQTHSLYPPLPKGHKSAQLQTNGTRKIFY